MKLHENYLNPGPLTDSGLSGRNCCRMNLPDSSRARFEPPVNGHTRLIAISGERTPGIERGLAYDSSPGELESETYAVNPGSMFLYPDFSPAGFLKRHDLTEFQKQISSVETSPVQAELVLLYTEPVNKFSCSGIVEMLPHLTTQRHRRRILKPTSLVRKTLSVGCSIDKTIARWQKPLGLKLLNHSLVRWQKTLGLNRLNHSLIKLGFFCGIEDSRSNSSKLFVC